MIKNDKKRILKWKNRGQPYYNKPVSTRDTVARVRGVSRCAKNQNRTRTRGTRFKSTAGLPVPVLNPNHNHLVIDCSTSKTTAFAMVFRRISSDIKLCALALLQQGWEMDKVVEALNI